MALIDMVNSYQELLEKKESLAEETKNNNAKIEALKQDIAQQMIDDDCPRIAAGDYMFSLQIKSKYSKRSEEYLAANGKTQLHIAETEKYAHVTFFFNGGEEKQFDGEERILIKSPDVATFDMKPEMSAYEVTDAVVDAINSDKFDVIILNYANCDMVGHTGIMEAAVKAVEAVDECVGRMVDAILAKGGQAIITADHGNADCLIDPVTKAPFTAHTTNPVPMILVGAGDVKVKNGRLCDLCPTMLDLMGLEKPEQMTGESLIVK